MKALVFTYSISDIQNRVLNITSVLGKNRETDKGEHLTDRLALTPGEVSIFNDYLEEAVSETYSWVQAFGIDIPNSNEIDAANDKVVFTLEQTWHYDENKTNSIDRYLRDSIVYYIVYRWLEITKPDEAEVYYEKHQHSGHEAQLGLNSEKVILQRRYNINH